MPKCIALRRRNYSSRNDRRAKALYNGLTDRMSADQSHAVFKGKIKKTAGEAAQDLTKN